MITALLAGLLAVAAPASAAQSTGEAFLQITPSARSYSLGMAPAITSLGAEAIGANPANLGLLRERFEAFSSYATLLEGTQYEHLAAAFAPWGAPAGAALGLSVTRLQAGGFEGADAAGNKTGSSFGASDLAIGLSGAFKPVSDVRLGVTVKAVQSELAGYKSNTALAGDFGAAYTVERFERPMTVGLSVTNAGQGVKFVEQTDKLPTTAHLGLALPLGRAMLVLALNRGVYDQQTTLGSGLELALGPVSFRAGYLTQNQATNLAAKDLSGPGRILNGLSCGLGLQAGPVRFDYAVSQQAVEFGPTQRVALSMRWGGSAASAAQEWKADPDRSDWQIRSMGSY